ncbi:hypothetical protein BC937DRAFT_92597 [Endogone sp. FLAS-F59071]|nr:hypothetical protein BC937DRAFT_92597 [Endogone sp. FLAS-F59071]|eukprot:RUS21480.1 hypothetical protein BC937DRAFT_92597 [Endogone sp. FLAS-F59071]
MRLVCYNATLSPRPLLKYSPPHLCYISSTVANRGAISKFSSNCSVGVHTLPLPASIQKSQQESSPNLKHSELNATFKDGSSLSSVFSDSLSFCHASLKNCVADCSLSKAIEAVEHLKVDSRNHVKVAPTRETYSLLLEVAEVDTYNKDDVAKISKWFYDDSQTPLPADVLSDIEMWNRILKIALRLGSSVHKNALPLLAKGIERRFDAFAPENEETLCLLLKMPKTNGILKRVEKLEEYMRIMSQSAGPSSLKLNETIVIAYAHAGLQKKADEILQKYIRNGYVPSTRLRYKLARNYAYHGNLLAVKEVMNDSTVLANISATSTDDKYPFLSVLVLAHKLSLEKYLTTFALRFGTTGLNRQSSGFANKLQPLHDSWRELMTKISLSDAALIDIATYNRMVEYHILANRIDCKQFPMLSAEDVVKSMEARGLQPDFGSFFNLIRGYARTREYDSLQLNVRLDLRRNMRLDKALQVLQRMENAGIDTKHQAIFQALFEACLPHTEQYNFDNFYLSRKLSTPNQQFSKYRVPAPAGAPVALFVDPRVFEIERIMLASKIPHDRITLKTLLTCLGVSGQYRALWRRWRDLQIEGVHRDAGLYQRVLALCSLDADQARYALTVVRLQMSRETPPIEASWGIYESLLDCCIASQDLVSAREIIGAIKKDIVCRSSQLHSKACTNNPQLYTPMVRACFSIRGLENEGLSLLEEARDRGVKFDNELWTEVMSYLVCNGIDHAEVQRAFNTFTMLRFERTTKVPIPATENGPIIPFPSAPYTPTDTKIINLYLASLLRTQNLMILRAVLSTYAEQVQGLHIWRDTVRGLTHLALKEKSFDDVKWIVNEIAAKVAEKPYFYRKWLQRSTQRTLND